MESPVPAPDAARFAAAVRQFDAANARDPNRHPADGAGQPHELVYAQWLTDWVLALCPDASEALRLAARCQHLCRWEIPRDSFPLTRPGYLQWRAELKKFHAEKSGAILAAVGYEPVLIRRVQALNLKQDFPRDPEGRVLEDALCLVFLERQFADLARKTDDAKLIGVLQKTWQKMTPAAQARALALELGSREKDLLAQALDAPRHED